MVFWQLCGKTSQFFNCSMKAALDQCVTLVILNKTIRLQISSNGALPKNCPTQAPIVFLKICPTEYFLQCNNSAFAKIVHLQLSNKTDGVFQISSGSKYPTPSLMVFWQKQPHSVSDDVLAGSVRPLVVVAGGGSQSRGSLPVTATPTYASNQSKVGLYFCLILAVFICLYIVFLFSLLLAPYFLFTASQKYSYLLLQLVQGGSGLMPFLDICFCFCIVLLFVFFFPRSLLSPYRKPKVLLPTPPISPRWV